MMNAEAKRLGMKDTHFMDATGLPNPGHYSSARDMAVLARAIIYADPAHYALYAQKDFTWNGIHQPNRNLLLWRDDGVDGLKTGHTVDAGYCMKTTTQKKNKQQKTNKNSTDSEAARATETAKLLGYG